MEPKIKSYCEKVFEAIQKASDCKYTLTSVYIGGKIAYYMNPSVQDAWEEFLGIKREFRGEY